MIKVRIIIIIFKIDKMNEAGDGTTDDTTEYLHLLDDTIDFRTLF